MLRKQNLAIYVFLTILSVSIGGFSGCGEVNKKISESRKSAAEKAIAEKPDFRETDDFCRQIPLPEGTKFIEKARVYNWVGLSYYYYSDKRPEDLEKFFREYFTKNGWEPIKPDTAVALTADFKNDKFEVAITLTGITGDANFSIHCEKLNTGQK